MLTSKQDSGLLILNCCPLRHFTASGNSLVLGSNKMHVALKPSQYMYIISNVYSHFYWHMQKQYCIVWGFFQAPHVHVIKARDVFLRQEINLTCLNTVINRGVTIVYSIDCIHLFTGCVWNSSFIQPETQTIPQVLNLMLRVEFKSFSQSVNKCLVYTLSNCCIIISLYCYFMLWNFSALVTR